MDVLDEEAGAVGMLGIINENGNKNWFATRLKVEQGKRISEIENLVVRSLASAAPAGLPDLGKTFAEPYIVPQVDANILLNEVKMGAYGYFRYCILVSVIVCACCAKVPPTSMNPNLVNYEVLEDYMDSKIIIGVAPDVTKKQLEDILRKAADDHQDDPARDYISVEMYLWVKAYLVVNGHRSSLEAGSLRRYVPPMNPEERKNLKTDRHKDDRIKISIDDAKKTLNI